MSGFADTTAVSPEKTRADIEGTLRRYGASSFVSGFDGPKAFVMFKCKDRTVRFVVTMPSPAEKRFRYDGRGRLRKPAAQEAEHAQAVRSYWRRLLLCIKAKLESVETVIESFEEAFLAQIVLPDNSTVGQWAATAIPAAYTTGRMPSGLLALPPAKDDVSQVTARPILLDPGGPPP